MELLLLYLLAFSNFHGCALAPDNLTGYVVTLDTILVLKTTDGGATWHPLNTTASRKFFDVTCTDANHVWTCGVIGEIMHSPDGGNTWIMQSTGASKYLTRIEFYDNQYGWSVGGDGVVTRTRDGGETWDQYFTPFYLAEFYGLAFLDTLTAFAVAGWPDHYELEEGYIVKSTDGGIRWTLLKQSTGFEDYLDICALNDSILVVVGGNDTTLEPIILRSTDGGNTWDSITNIPQGARYLRAVDCVGNKIWAVGRTGTIIYSEDGGITWTLQHSPCDTTLFDVDFSDELHGIACGYNYILYTTDGGQTWHNGVISAIPEENTEKAPFSILNPVFSKELYVKFEKSGSPFKVIVADVSGKIVLKEDLIGNKMWTWNGKNQLGKTLSPGVYIITVESSRRDYTKKVVKMR